MRRNSNGQIRLCFSSCISPPGKWSGRWYSQPRSMLLQLFPVGPGGCTSLPGQILVECLPRCFVFRLLSNLPSECAGCFWAFWFYRWLECPLAPAQLLLSLARIRLRREPGLNRCRHPSGYKYDPSETPCPGGLERGGTSKPPP